METKLSILFVAHTDFMGGASCALLEMIEELRSNYKVYPIVLVLEPRLGSPYYDRTLVDECEKRNIKCVRNRYFWFKQKKLKWKLLYLLDIFYLPQILIKLKREKYDLVHSNSSVVDAGVFLSRIRKVPHIWHFREFGSEFGLYPVFGKRYESCLYKKCEAIITISPVMQKYYKLRVPDPSKLHLVWDGVAIPKTLRPSEHKSNRLELCMVGIVNEAKNQMEALEALNLIVNKKNFKQIHLTIIGENKGAYYKRICDFIDSYNLSQYVTFTGNVNNVTHYLSKMDIGLMLSKSEGFGRVTVEYMYNNLAVISSDTGASPEILGCCGCIYHLGNINALASKIIQLGQDKKLLLDIATAGQKKAFANFSAQTSARNVMDVYINILSKRDRGSM